MKNTMKKALQIVLSYVMMFLLWTVILIGASDGLYEVVNIWCKKV